MVQPRQAILHVIENVLLQNRSRDSMRNAVGGCSKKFPIAVKKIDGPAGLRVLFLAAIQ